MDNPEDGDAAQISRVDENGEWILEEVPIEDPLRFFLIQPWHPSFLRIRSGFI